MANPGMMRASLEKGRRGGERLGRSERKLPEPAITGRSAERYFEMFNLPDNKEYFRGTTIFDVGSGHSEFAKYMKEAHPECNVISIEPRIFSSLWKEEVERPSGAVSARAEEMPFKEGSADEILASWSVPYYSKNDYTALRSIYEMLRCLKIGGQLKMTPFNDPEGLDSDWDKVVTDRGMKILKRLLREGGLASSFYQFRERDYMPGWPGASYTFIIRRRPDSSLEEFKEYLDKNKERLRTQRRGS